MKKILFLLVALACSMNMSAQFMKIMKDGKYVAAYKVSQADRVVFEKELEEKWTPLFIGDYYHRVQSFAQSGSGVFSKEQSITNSGSVLYQSQSDPTRYKIAPWFDNEMIFTMDADNKITVINANTGVYYENTYICVTDLKTAQKLNFDSQYDTESGEFYFGLLWHDQDDTTAQNGAWGFTQDTFAVTSTYGEDNTRQQVKTSQPTIATNLYKDRKAQLSTEALKANLDAKSAALRGHVAKDLPRRK